MTSFTTLLQQQNAWLFIPSAILLGALHGLEPGHSKTMMAAFIVAIRGTVTQAVLLGLAATLSHTAVVWLIALGGMYFGQHWSAETSEPYLQLASGALIIGVAIWMVWKTWSQKRHTHEHGHGHTETHGHRHAALPIHAQGDRQRIKTEHGVVCLERVAEGFSARFRLSRANEACHCWPAEQTRLVIESPDGQQQSCQFVQHDGFVESEPAINLPHRFLAHLRLGTDHHHHDYAVSFSEQHSIPDLVLADDAYQDEHERAHANAIEQRFASKEASTGQIIVFGLTGGLIPCPASITVLLLCLQLKKFSLGATLVLSFSFGLALTMVLSGVLAALSVKHLAKRWEGFGRLASKAPYFSGGLITLVGLYIGFHGWLSLAGY